MSRLALDIRSNHDSGVCRYGLGLLRPVVEHVTSLDVDVTVLVRPWQAERATRLVAGIGRCEVVAITEHEGFVRRSETARKIVDTCDLYYTSHYLFDRAYSCPTAFTVHDLIRIRYPESATDEAFVARFGTEEFQLIEEELANLSPDPSTGTAGVFARYFSSVTRELLAKAELVVTVSDSSAWDIAALAEAVGRKLVVARCGVDTTTFSPCPAPDISDMRRRFGIDGRYFVFVGQPYPHKRFDWLVECLQTFNEHREGSVQLVAVGDGLAERYGAVVQPTDGVVYVGHVCDQDLAALYSGATAVISASVSEGSGLPPQEALACGAEVIVPDIDAFRETVGVAGHFYTATSQDELVQCMAAAADGLWSLLSHVYMPVSWETEGRRVAERLLTLL